jgi:hypothetical protein
MSRALTARQRLGGTIRLNPDNPEKIASARRDLAAAKIADYVERVVSTAPPLTEDQRARIATLLSAARDVS